MPTMTQQRAIPSGDHGTGVSEKGFDGMARGGCLPVVAVKRINAKYDLRDLLLRSSSPMTVEGLQHPAQSHALLPSQTGVGRYRAAMKSGEQAANGFEPVEAFQAERDEGAERFGRRRRGRLNKPYALAVAEIENQIGLAVGVDADSGVNRRRLVSAGGQNIGRRAKNDGACIVLGKPDHTRLGRSLRRIHREIATPIAVRSFQPASGDHLCRRSVLENPCRRIRCDGAIPTRRRTRSCPGHARSVSRSASRKHLVSSRSSLSS